MFDKSDDELIKRLIEEAEAIIEKELQKQLNADTDNLENSDESTPKAKSKRTRNTAISSETSADDSEPKPKRRRGRPRKNVDADNAETQAKPIAKSISREKQGGQLLVKEAILEFVERQDGVLVLQEVGREDEPMVTISFSEQVKDMIGKDNIQNVGQNMIHAAIAAVMQRQISAWHAHVYDEMPKRYS